MRRKAEVLESPVFGLRSDLRRGRPRIGANFFSISLTLCDPPLRVIRGQI